MLVKCYHHIQLGKGWLRGTSLGAIKLYGRWSVTSCMQELLVDDVTWVVNMWLYYEQYVLDLEGV